MGLSASKLCYRPRSLADGSSGKRLFHVQEHRLTLAQIGALLHEHDLTFLGFDNLHPIELRTA